MDKKIMIFSFLTILVVLLTFHLVSDLNKNYNMKIKENGDSLKEILMVVNNQELEIVLENNSCTKELLKKLENGELNINLNDYGNFEKVGELGFELPSSDSYINTSPGDVMLYLGNTFYKSVYIRQKKIFFKIYALYSVFKIVTFYHRFLSSDF